jgi:hypothetical protein
MMLSLLAAAPRYLQLSRSQYWGAWRFAAYRDFQLQLVLQAAAAIPFYAQRFHGVPHPQDLRQLQGGGGFTFSSPSSRDSVLLSACHQRLGTGGRL